MRCNQLKHNRGFTLIEMIIGIVVFAIAMTMMTSLILPRAKQSIDPIYQVRAAKLANSLLDEIKGKEFDENSNTSLGLGRCDESSNPCSTTLGADGTETRDSFNDVDDYHGLEVDGLLLNHTTQSYQDLYKNYALTVNVIYDGDYDGVADSSRKAKLITITVTMPNQETVSFATYRSNY